MSTATATARASHLAIRPVVKDTIIISVVNGFHRVVVNILITSPQSMVKILQERREETRKSPNIFFESVADADDDFFDKAVEGAVMFALKNGEICTCPSRILVHENIYDRFMERVIKRTNAISWLTL